MTTETNPRTIISESKLKELAQVHEPQCASVFIPTQREGNEVNENQSQIRLKNTIQDIEKELEEAGLKPREIEEFLKPLWKLQDDVLFWRHQSDGLAIFRNHNRFEYFTLPLDFDQTYYLDENFYLLPVLPMFNNDGFFFILSLNLQHVKLYEASAHTIGEIYIEDLVPQRLEDAVGYDYEEKTVQSRPDKGHMQDYATHGHGSGKDDVDHEVKTFLYAVNDGLMKVLNDQNAPLIMIMEDQYLGEFSSIFEYAHLHDDHISRNPKGLEIFDLHELAWEKVYLHFRKHFEEEKQQYNKHSASGLTSEDIYHILPAALDGQVQTLFLKRAYDVFGIYDHAKRELRIDENNSPANTSLINLAALRTFINGGSVYQVEAEAMPVPVKEINALYRYQNPEAASKMGS